MQKQKTADNAAPKTIAKDAFDVNTLPEIGTAPHDVRECRVKNTRHF
ncbi:MAG: hypothetical protein HYT28_03475 [Parcubacteria group bacterium]|nr:hypothetical protein [Parcubacteria group bacterium]